MNKFTLMLLSLFLAIGASATEYTGTMTVKTVNNELTREGMTLNVEENENGTYNARMGFSFKVLNYEMNVAEMQFENMLGVTTSDGYTTITGAQKLNLLEISGLSDMIPSWLQPYIGSSLDTTVPVAFTARFNGTYAVATMCFQLNVSITIPILNTTMEVINTPVLIALEDLPPAGTDPGTGIQGDVDNSGNVDIDDVNALVNILLKQ